MENMNFILNFIFPREGKKNYSEYCERSNFLAREGPSLRGIFRARWGTRWANNFGGPRGERGGGREDKREAGTFKQQGKFNLEKRSGLVYLRFNLPATKGSRRCYGYRGFDVQLHITLPIETRNRINPGANRRGRTPLFPIKRCPVYFHRTSCSHRTANAGSSFIDIRFHDRSTFTVNVKVRWREARRGEGELCLKGSRESKSSNGRINLRMQISRSLNTCLLLVVWSF